MSETRTIKIAIVEDVREIREGLGRLINSTPGFRCTGVYASMEEALEKIPHNLPDLVLSDIGLPGIDGISGIKILKERYPDLLILMLTIYDDDERPATPNPANHSVHQDTCLYFLSPDPDAAYEFLRSKGLQIDPPTIAYYGMKQLYVRDPDGYTLCFQCQAEPE